MLRITLIHGTFAKNAAWVKADSPFCAQLRATLGHLHPVIDSFTWSGKNTWRDREDAALALQQDIAVTSLPGQVRFLIGHSHGGSVALRALQSAETAAKIAGLVCLSTPCVHMRRRRYGLRARDYDEVFGIAAFLFVVMVLACLFALFFGVVALLTGGFPDEKTAMALTFVTAVIMTYRWLPMRRRAWRAMARRIITSSRPLGIGHDRVLFFRHAGDEATGALATAMFLSWVLGVLWRLTSVAERWSFGFVRLVDRLLMPLAPLFRMVWGTRWRKLFTVLGCAGAAAIASALRAYKTVSALLVLPVDLLLVVPLLFFVCIMLILYSVLFRSVLLILTSLFSGLLLRFAYGRDLFWYGAVLDCSVEATPEGTWQVRHVPLPSRRAGLAHSLAYADPNVCQGICDWIAEKAT